MMIEGGQNDNGQQENQGMATGGSFECELLIHVGEKTSHEKGYHRSIHSVKCRPQAAEKNVETKWLEID